MQNQVPCLINVVKDDLLPENVYSRGKSCNLDHLTKKPPKYQPQDNFSINLIFW